MKKSQLRNIIRESVKELMTEQTVQLHKWQGFYGNCNASGNVSWTLGWSSVGATTQNIITGIASGSNTFYQTMGSPQPGEFIGGNHGTGANFATPGGYSCWKYRGMVPYGTINNWRAEPWNMIYSSFNVYPDCNTCSNQTVSNPCDTTTSSPCAVQWWQNPNANWASNWITNRDCTNYGWPANNLEQQAIQIMAGAPNPQTGPYNNASDIWSAAAASNLPNPQKGRFIGKMAKAKYSQCQIQACNC